jgi:hypothetical protein
MRMSQFVSFTKQPISRSTWDRAFRFDIFLKLLELTVIQADIFMKFSADHGFFSMMLRVTWVASVFRGSLLGNSFVTRKKYWRSC